MLRSRTSLRSLTLVLVIGGASSVLARAQSPGQKTTPSSTRFQREIDAFLKVDSTSLPETGRIEFVGSSIFRLWSTLGEQMPTLPVFNRAFGGSQTADVLYYMDRIVLPYRPRFVVYYCGSNDVSAGENAAAIVGRVQQFHERLQRELPATRMFFVSVIRAPEKRNRWAVVDSVNLQLRQYAATAKNIDFIEINPSLVDSAGAVRGALYLPDSLHYRPEAYVLFTGVIKPVLERAWSASSP